MFVGTDILAIIDTLLSAVLALLGFKSMANLIFFISSVFLWVVLAYPISIESLYSDSESESELRLLLLLSALLLWPLVPPKTLNYDFF